jgi:sorting nexin-25
VSYLDRLYTAKGKVEQRIVVLGGEDDSVCRDNLFKKSWLKNVDLKKSGFSETTTPYRLTLRDVLTNPSSLSYFMEFMDRRNRSLLVQFWLTVESFKNPLESVDSDSSEDEYDPIQDLRSETVKEDITMINDLYFSTPTRHPALAAISLKHINAIHDFALDQSPSNPVSERKVRRNVMLAQRQVERDMDQDFEDFQRSELWFRVLGDTESSKTMLSASFSSTVSSPASTVERKSLQDPRRSRAPIIITPALDSRSDSLPSLSVSFNLGSGPTPSNDPAPKTFSNLDVLMSTAGESTGNSRAPLFDESDSKAYVDDAQLQRMEAIEAALTDIIALDNQQSDKPRRELSSELISEELGFLPSAGYGGKRTAGSDDEVEGDDERTDETDTLSQSVFQLTGPGDLQLTYEIARLGDKLSNLQSQDLMLDKLIKKAELTGDTQESRLLQKSKSALNREIRELSFQKTQYEQQESANRLVSDRTKLAIMNSTVADEEGKSVVRYIVEVQQLASDGSYGTGWVVARRYNEFLSMHNRLRDRHHPVRNLDFPGKRIVTGLSGPFVDARRTALEKYMQVRT